MDPTKSLIADAEAIADRVAATAVDSERDRRLAPVAVEAMTEANLWRILTPRVYGGLEGGLRAQVETVMVMAGAYSAAGWVQMVVNAHAYLVGCFPMRCQDEVFGDDPNARIPGALAAQGTTKRVEDGWLLDGCWQFASGVDCGDWVLLGARAEPSDEGAPRYLHVVVPKAEVVVDDTWHSLGLRGTGSKDIVARNVLVPEHRSIESELLWTGRSPHGDAHATRLYRLPLIPSLAIQMSSAVVGMAQAALGVHLDRTRGRVEVYTTQAKSQRPGTQLRLAECHAELAAAALLVRHAADDCDEAIAAGSYMSIAERVRLRWHASYAVELTRRAADRFYASAGGHAIYDDSDLQRHYRDVNTACHHAIVDFDTTAEVFGRQQLGLDVSGMG
jgi:alkylation response protein AidB-like acyl-CoA dehydrogenase